MRARLRALAEARETVRQRIAAARETDEDLGQFTTGRDGAGVSQPVRSAADWSWRFLVIVGAITVLGYVVLRLKLIIFPVVVALLLSALLSPIVNRLRRLGLHRALATMIVFIGGLAIVAGVFTALVTLLTNQFGELSDNVSDGVDQIRDWLIKGPFHLTDSQIDNFGKEISDWVSSNRGVLAGGAVATATVAIEVLGAMLLTLFTTYFFLYDGARVWRWCAKLFPRRAEASVLEAGQRAWVVLVSYVRATLIIAAVDGVGIGILVAVLGVPLAAPLGVLVFFGAFVPIVGATVSGAVAVLVALVAKGVVAALVVLAGVIAIQQLEGHILQPLIMGRFVRIHPLAVVLAVAVGGVVAGIPGTVIAVPFAAVLKTVVSYYATRYRERVDAETGSAEGVAAAGEVGGVATDAPVGDGTRLSELPAAPAVEPP
jgi:predicted PurR-regulated permease PerM